MEARKAHVSQRSTYFFRLLDVRYVDFSKTIITDNAVFFNIDFNKAPEPEWADGVDTKEAVFMALYDDIREAYGDKSTINKHECRQNIDYDKFYIKREVKYTEYPLTAFAYKLKGKIYDGTENTLEMRFWLIKTLAKKEFHCLVEQYGIEKSKYDECNAICNIYNKFCADTEEWIKERVRLTIEETGGEFMTDAITDNSYCQLRNIDGETVAVCISNWSKQIKNGKYKTL